MIKMVEPVFSFQWTDRWKNTGGKQGDFVIGKARAAFGRKGTTPVGLSIQERLRHSFKLGGTGSGKSVSVLGEMLRDVKAGQPFMALDPHDTIQKLLRLIASRVVSGEIPEATLDNIILVSPGHDGWCVRINPLECPSPEKAPVRIAPVMELLRVFWGSALGPQTHEFTQNFLTLLAERKLPLARAPETLIDTAALRAHASNLLSHRAREYFLNRFLAWSPRRRSQVMEAFLNKITIFLSDPRIAAMLDSGISDFDFREAMDRGKTVLIEINKGQFFDSVGLLASMILVSLQQATFSRADLPETARSPYFMVIEEFPSFAGSVTVEPFLNESRKFGVGLTLIAQTLASIDRALLSSLRANCYTQIFFRLSPEDARIASAGLTGEVRDLIGRELVELPIGTAMLMQGGSTPRRLLVDHTKVPSTTSRREKNIIERIRRNVGQPLNLSSQPDQTYRGHGKRTSQGDAQRVNTRPKSQQAVKISSSSSSDRRHKSRSKSADGFFEGDI